MDKNADISVVLSAPPCHSDHHPVILSEAKNLMCALTLLEAQTKSAHTQKRIRVFLTLRIYMHIDPSQSSNEDSNVLNSHTRKTLQILKILRFAQNDRLSIYQCDVSTPDSL